jgi:hypothetical protein
MGWSAAMSRRTAAATRLRHMSGPVLWAAFALALAVALLATPRPPIVWASNGGGITIATPADGVFVLGSSLTASFTTDGALYGNTPLSVSFISSTSGTVIYSKYTLLSAAGTPYTASIFIPDLVPGEYVLVIEAPEINGGKLTSNPIIVVVPSPTPVPTSQPAPVVIGTQAHEVLSGPAFPGGLIAAGAAGVLLVVSLALLIVPPLRSRGNQPSR